MIVYKKAIWNHKNFKDLGENVVNEMNIIVKFTCKEKQSSTI